jgi:hypothetical protein
MTGDPRDPLAPEPRARDRPTPLRVDYASPQADRSRKPARRPAVVVGQFVGGMACPVVAWAFAVGLRRLLPGVTMGCSGLLFVLVPPIVMLFRDRTRLAAAGWLTSLALGFIALLITCAR